MRYTLKKAIIATLSYSDIFNFPLTLTEIHRYLTGHKISIDSLKKLITTANLKKYKGYYYLPGKKKTVANRLKRTKTSIQKIVYAKSIATKISLIPSIKAIYITGALAMKNSDQDDDIDLMIITKSDTLWLTRLITNILLDIFGLRRKPASHLNPITKLTTHFPQPNSYSNKLCLNLWLDQSSLSIPAKIRNLYSAHEIAQAIPIFDGPAREGGGGVHQQFLHQNRWISKFLPNFPIPKKPTTTRPKIESSALEKLAYKLQRHHMRSKITREKISPHSAFFHPRDTKSWVMREYNNRLKKLAI